MYWISSNKIDAMVLFFVVVQKYENYLNLVLRFKILGCETNSFHLVPFGTKMKKSISECVFA
jgi:hypothetical protein